MALPCAAGLALYGVLVGLGVGRPSRGGYALTASLQPQLRHVPPHYPVASLSFKRRLVSSPLWGPHMLRGSRAFNWGGSIEPPTAGGEGWSWKRAQLTGPLISYYELWRRKPF